MRAQKTRSGNSESDGTNWVNLTLQSMPRDKVARERDFCVKPNATPTRAARKPHQIATPARTFADLARNGASRKGRKKWSSNVEGLLLSSLFPDAVIILA